MILLALLLSTNLYAIETLPTEILNLRDPFRKPTLKAPKRAAHVNDLESYDSETFKLVGVLTGPDRLKAMLQSPDGKTFFVSERMRIGTRKGIINKISPEAIYIREKSINILGQEENLDIEIRLMANEKKGAAPLVSSEISTVEKERSQTSNGGNPDASYNLPPSQNPGINPTDPGGRR